MPLLVLSLTLFVATNIDDIFLLAAFFANPRLRPRQIVIGQYLGIGALVVVSLVAALIALVIPPAYVGLLGLVPIAIGCKKVFEVWQGQEDEDEQEGEGLSRKSRYGPALAVAAVTIANGGDNIAIYTPAFAVRSGIETAAILAVFAVMTGVWCAIAHGLVHHPSIGAPLRRYGHRALPLVLIGLGLWIMIEAGTLAFLASLRTG